LYKLKNHRSLGFAFTNYITEKEFDKLTLGQKHKIVNKSIVVEEKDVKKLTELQPYYQSVLNDSSPKQLLIRSFKENEIRGSIKIDQPSMLFLSIPFDDGWKISVNGH
ncbi:YfhO family protein, partial [Flavobacterium sp. K77]|uniref:YfhO family protein n=1 Tax=Flavobacterium sp. K77 TaxID=2910676 RepID=UPI001F43827A